MNSARDPAIEEELEEFRNRYRQLVARIPAADNKAEWATDNKTVFSVDAMRVRQFSPGKSASSPVLIVYSHVNSPHVIDLHRDHSLVQRLLECGHNVYLLDWGQTRNIDCTHDLAMYIDDYIDEAVEYVRHDSGKKTVKLLGVCQGGTFAICYAALHPDKVSRLVPVVTPVDFHAGRNILHQWVKHVNFDPLEQSPVNVPGEAITRLFQLIRPFKDLKRQVEVIDNLPNQKQLDLTALMDQWVYHCPDQPGRAFAQFIRQFFQENRLVRNELEVGGKSVRLDQIACPVLNVYARQDHLVPPESSAALGNQMDSRQYQEAVFEGGHIGLMISEKAQQTILPEIGRWLAGPSYRQGKNP